jgi:hypothetical protein
MEKTIRSIDKIENSLMVAGILVGLFILSTFLFSNVPFYVSALASLFGFSATIPKLRSLINVR